MLQIYLCMLQISLPMLQSHLSMLQCVLCMLQFFLCMLHLCLSMLHCHVSGLCHCSWVYGLVQWLGLWVCAQDQGLGPRTHTLDQGMVHAKDLGIRIIVVDLGPYPRPKALVLGQRPNGPRAPRSQEINQPQ